MLSHYILTHLELELDLPYLKMYFIADWKELKDYGGKLPIYFYLSLYRCTLPKLAG